MDHYGQVAIEYLLIFFVSIIILSLISIPLVTQEVNNTEDIKKTMEVKSVLSELANTVNIVYSSDYGSSRTISINSPDSIRVSYKNSSGKHYLYSTVVLSNNSKKEVKVQVPCRVSFANQSSYYYTNIYERWYYNTEVKWINTSDNGHVVNIYFK